MFDSIVFYSSASLLILFALLTIKFNNLFYSLLSAIIVFFMAGVLFFLLNSEYNAVIQLAIYGFAIPITLGVAIMFTSEQKLNKIIETEKSNNSKYFICLFIGLFLLSFFYLVLTSLTFIPNSFKINEFDIISSFNSIDIFTNGIFSKYILAFELISVILTIIVIGLTMYTRRAK